MQASTSWDDVAFSSAERDRHLGIRPVSQLDTWPVASPVNASRRPSRDAAHHSGSGRMASPFPVGDFHLLFFASFPGALRSGSKCETLNLSDSSPLTSREQTTKRRVATSLTGQKATSVRPPAQGLKSCIRCGHLLNERLKSNDDFGCSLTVANDEIEHLPNFFQVWRFGAQPV
jgi:hypothetical protein